MDDLVKAFLDEWAPTEKIRAQMEPQLRAIIQAERPTPALGDDAIDKAQGRAERRAREVLARLAPPGTKVTEALKKQVRDEVMAIVISELQAVGVPAQLAQVISALVAAGMKVKEKPSDG